MKAKGGNDAIGASPKILQRIARKTGRKPRIPLIPSPAAGVQLGKDFTAAAEKIAAREAKLSPQYDPAATERRASTTYTINQLSPETVSAIGVAYQGRDKTVKAIAAEFRIHPGTVYELAGKHGWPKREAVAHAAKRISSVTPEIAQAALDRLSTDAGAAAIHDAAELLDEEEDLHRSRDSDRQHLSKSALVDQAGRDVLLESYATATAEVLAIHRELSGDALSSGKTLLAIFNEAITEVREAYKHDARAAAKAVSQLAKEYNSLLGSLQKAIDMQRQAYALDDMAGKGIGLEQMQLIRAIRAGMVRPDQVAGMFLPAPNQGSKGDEGQGSKANPPAMVIEGSYEELVRAAEAQGVALQ